MAGQWKHGWIPISPGAVMSKNHGRTPGGGSKLGKKLTGMQSGGSKPKASPPSSSTAELQELAKTAKGRKEIMRRQRERENALSSPARDAAAKAGFTGPQRKRKPHRKSALKGRRR